MKIAFVGPITPHSLNFVQAAHANPPRGHHFGMNSDLVNGLIERGHTVEVFTTAPQASAWFQLDAAPHRLTMVPSRGRLSALRLFASEIAALHQAIRARGPFDIVHAHWLYEYALAALQTEYPVLVTLHDWPSLILRYQPSILRLGKYLLSRKVVARTRFASAPSAYMADIGQRELGLQNLALIPNAIPPSLLLHKRRTFPADPVLLAINIGFHKHKNVAALIKAFAEVRRTTPRATLRLVGADYGPGEAAEQFARGRHLSDGINFVGQLDRDGVLAELAGATIFVHPSLEESFGLVLIEAMSQKVPVIGGQQAGAVPWILDEGRAGYLAAVEDPAQLAKAIETALHDPDLATRAEAGWQRVRTEFTADKMVERYVEHYNVVRELW
jgi:glycosyltransferase involved in cell wall biosynthesis